MSHQRKMEQRSLTSQSRVIQLLEIGGGLKTPIQGFSVRSKGNPIARVDSSAIKDKTLL